MLLSKRTKPSKKYLHVGIYEHFLEDCYNLQEQLVGGVVTNAARTPATVICHVTPGIRQGAIIWPPVTICRLFDKNEYYHGSHDGRWRDYATQKAPNDGRWQHRWLRQPPARHVWQLVPGPAGAVVAPSAAGSGACGAVGRGQRGGRGRGRCVGGGVEGGR